MRVLIVGCGYVGVPLGAELKKAGHEVFGLRRSQSAELELEAAGIHPVIADITKPDSLTELPGPFDWVVNCTAAGGGGPEEYRRVYVDGMRILLEWLAASPPSRFVYTGSTGVYAQDDGAWVTEASPAEPASDTGRILREAEEFLLQACRDSGFPAVVLRLAGIYGPGRGYWFRQFLSGQAALEGDGGRFLNMIHRDDVVGAVIAGLARGKPGEIYNVVDEEPVAQRELFRWLSKTLHQPMPPVGLADGSRLRRAATNKRISNVKLKTELGYRFKFPTFREGFACWREA